MNSSLGRYLTLVSLVLSCTPAEAALFCVDDNTEFQNALNVASNNGQDDLIQVAGENRVYTGSVAVSAFHYTAQENFDLEIVGGFAATGGGCVFDAVDAVSIVDGGGFRQGLSILGTGTGDITIRDMKFRNGMTSRNGAGLAVGEAGFRGDVIVRNSHFENNDSAGSGGGLYVITEGDVEVADNAFVGNVAGVDAGAARIAARSQLVGLRNLVSHNTVVDNGCAVGAPATCDVGGFQFSADATSALYNNLFHGNEGSALHLQGEPGILAHNNVGLVTGTTPASSYGNLAVADPRFINAAANPPDLRLQEDSPLIDRGTDDFPSPASHTPRGQAPDIGHAEHVGLRFRDGFEN